jgi:hypothetical protein
LETQETKKTQKKKKLLNVALQQNFQSGRSTSIYGGRKAFQTRRQKIHHFNAANRDFAIPLFERERERERFEADHPYKPKEQQEASNPNSPRPLPGALPSPGMLATV